MKIFSHFAKQLSSLGNQLLPTQCLACGCTLHGELLCEGCTLDLPWAAAHSQCQQCGLGLMSDSLYCGQCLNKPPSFSESYIPFAYHYPLNAIIHQFKYRRSLACGKLLGTLLAQHIKVSSEAVNHWTMPDLIIPTPIHWARRWQRGFNQTEILGEYIAKSLGVTMKTNIVKRKANAASQKELSRAERQKNLRNAFYIETKHKHLLQGKNIALIDDVVTTTATMRELSKQIMAAGAKEIQVWALARTM